MESDRTYHFLFKHVLLFAGILIMLVPVISFVFPDSVEINGETGSVDTLTAIVIELTGLLIILAFFAVKDKFVIVEFKNQNITIEHNGEKTTLSWLDIDSVSQIQFVQPPLYKLKTNASDETLWFNTEPKYISIGGFTTDTSDMGQLIKKKKKELGL